MPQEWNNLIKKEQRRNRVIDLLLIIAGSTLTAFATQYIFDPTGLVTGGVSGLAIIVRSLSVHFWGVEIPLWLSNLVLNIPIFLLAIYTDGFKRLLRTLLSWAITTVELAVFPKINFMPDNLLLVALYGGICFGAGSGLLLQAKATGGGTDTLGMSLHHWLRQYSIGRIIQVLDMIVVLCGLLVFGVERSLYALISAYIMGHVTDYILSKGKSAKIVFIISDSSAQIAQGILEEMDRGVTGLRGTGMYTGKERTILLCICSNKDIVEMKDIVREHDPHAFFVIGNVNEAMGEGFVEKWQ